MPRYCCASPEKVAEGGKGGGGEGTPTHFFPTSKKNQEIFHNGVGVLSTWT